MTLTINGGSLTTTAADGIRDAIGSPGARGFTNLVMNHDGVTPITAGVYRYDYTQNGTTVSLYRVITDTSDIFYENYTNNTPSGVVATRGEL